MGKFSYHIIGHKFVRTKIHGKFVVIRVEKKIIAE